MYLVEEFRNVKVTFFYKLFSLKKFGNEQVFSEVDDFLRNKLIKNN